jgi:hypothetical protein
MRSMVEGARARRLMDMAVKLNGGPLHRFAVPLPRAARWGGSAAAP